MAETIVGRIRNEKSDFRTQTIRIAKNYSYSQYQTLNRIELYYNSKFETGEFDEDGWKKPFFNIVRKPCMIAAKEIDLDTKDIIIRSEGDYVAAQLMSSSLKQWMKDQGFARSLNEYADAAPVYGSVVVKKVKDKLMTVDLKNLVITDTTARSLDYTDIIETHIYSEGEIRRVAASSGWDLDALDRILKVYARAGKSLIEVDERYGWVRESEIKKGGADDKLVYSLAIVAGSDETEESTDKTQLIDKGEVLYHEPVKAHPYREWHWMKMPNRWLGVGYVEINFDAQIRRNEVAYYKAKGLAWTSQHIFQTDDETASNNYQNLLSGVKNGDILKVQTGKSISPINNQERNLAHYASEEQVWERNVTELTFSPEIITGEGLPSGTPARSAMISDQNVKRFFDRKREDFGIFIKDLIENDIMPMFLKEKGKAHTYSFSGSRDDRDTIENLVLDTKLTDKFQDYVSRGTLPTLDEWNRIEAVERKRLSSRPTLEIDIPEGYFKNLKYRLDVVITKENEDSDSKVAGRQAVLQALSSNPMIATDPTTKPIFLELAHLLGVKNLKIPTAPPATEQLTGGLPKGQAGATMKAQDVLNSIPNAALNGTA